MSYSKNKNAECAHPATNSKWSCHLSSLTSGNLCRDVVPSMNKANRKPLSEKLYRQNSMMFVTTERNIEIGFCIVKGTVAFGSGKSGLFPRVCRRLSLSGVPGEVHTGQRVGPLRFFILRVSYRRPFYRVSIRFSFAFCNYHCKIHANSRMANGG